MKFLRNLKVSRKIGIIILASILSLIVSGVYSYKQLTDISYDMKDIYEEKFIPNGWITDAVQINMQIDSILIEMIYTTDLEEKKQLHSRINDGVNQVYENFAKYEGMELSDEEISEIADFYQAVDALTGNQDQMIEYSLAGQNEEAKELYNAIVKDARKNLVVALTNLNNIKTQQTQEISESNVALVESVARTLVISIAIITIVLLCLGFAISSSILKPLGILQKNIGVAKDGDFVTRVEFEAKDEIGQVLSAFNSMINSLHQAIHQVHFSANQVDENAGTLSSNIQQSTATTEHVVSAIQEITSGSEQTKIALENNSIILNRVQTSVAEIHNELFTIEEIASKSVQGAQSGATIISENVKQMEKIQLSIQESNNAIDNLSKQVGDVDNILQVVSSISEQTNLLALNAAIEAARAAEHGRGFAVVADEVRKLAEQSLNSTNSIAHILSNIKQETNQAVSNMNIVLEEANKGLSATHSTKEKFDEILVNTNEVAPLIGEMRSTVEKMSGALTQFVGNADAILSIAINNAANSEEVSASTEQQLNSMEYMKSSALELAEIAQKLNKVVQQFKI